MDVACCDFLWLAVTDEFGIVCLAVFSPSSCKDLVWWPRFMMHFDGILSCLTTSATFAAEKHFDSILEPTTAKARIDCKVDMLYSWPSCTKEMSPRRSNVAVMYHALLRNRFAFKKSLKWKNIYIEKCWHWTNQWLQILSWKRTHAEATSCAWINGLDSLIRQSLQVTLTVSTWQSSDLT